MRASLIQVTAISVSLAGCTAISGIADLREGSEATGGGTGDPSGQPHADGGAGGGSGTSEEGGGPNGSTHTLGVGDVRIFAGAGTTISSRMRRAGQTAWSPAVMEASLAGTLRFVIPFLDPKTFEENLAVQYQTDAGSIVEVMRRTASGWGSEVTTPPMENNHAAKRTFAVAMESSGDVLLVYAKSGSGVPVYRTRTVAGWSAETPVPLGGATLGSVLWVDLASHPRSDEITLAFSTTSADLYVQTWTGSAWSMPSFAKLEDELTSTEFPSFALAYEASSGDVLVAWGRHYGTGWATRIDGSASFGPVHEVPEIRRATPLAPMRAVAEPGTDRIAFVWETCLRPPICDPDYRFVGAVWDGSAFVALENIDEYVGARYALRNGSMPVGVGWFDGTAIGVYRTNYPTRLRWTRWLGGNAWTAPEIVPISPPLGDEAQVSYATLSTPSELLVVVADLEHLWAKSYRKEGWANADEGAPLFEFGVSTGVPFGLLTR
jgi:hypothetical protein